MEQIITTHGTTIRNLVYVLSNAKGRCPIERWQSAKIHSKFPDLKSCERGSVLREWLQTGTTPEARIIREEEVGLLNCVSRALHGEAIVQMSSQFHRARAKVKINVCN